MTMIVKHNLKRTTQEINFYLREYRRNIFAPEKSIQNIYHACIQKTGSQWIKAIFTDPRISKYTGLSCYPQQRYEMGEFRKKFPKYTFVPGLYIPYNMYEEISKPENYKTFYVIRDPRNVIVSWYYSMLESHSLMGSVPRHRTRLKVMNLEDGITYCIKHLQLKFSYVKSWVYSKDAKVLIVKFEDITDNPEEEFKRLFEHCNVDIPNFELTNVLRDYSKEKMRKRDLWNRNEKKIESHYRKKSSDWRNIFTNKHEDTFYKINGQLLEIIGYES